MPPQLQVPIISYRVGNGRTSSTPVPKNRKKNYKMTLILVAIGGSIGALLRYGIDQGIQRAIGETSLGIFIVNVIGSLILGLSVGWAIYKFDWPDNYSIFIGVGLCGSFTTFSTLMLASVNMMETGDYLKAIINIIGSVILGLVAAYVGLMIGKNYL